MYGPSTLPYYQHNSHLFTPTRIAHWRITCISTRQLTDTTTQKRTHPDPALSQAAKQLWVQACNTAKPSSDIALLAEAHALIESLGAPMQNPADSPSPFKASEERALPAAEVLAANTPVASVAAPTSGNDVRGKYQILYDIHYLINK